MNNSPAADFALSPALEAPPADTESAGALAAADTADREFVKIEKNLSALGFFSVSNTHLPQAKTIALTRTEAGKRVKVSVTISPSVPYGLPTAAHQDKTLAFLKLLLDRQDPGEPIQNPVTFHSSEVLRLLGLNTQAGKNYDDVYEWLDVMTYTGIKSEAALYLAGWKRYGTDRFHVFDRSVTYGKALDDGTLADKNYVWLSEWMLESLRNGYLISLDFDTYRQLVNPIAKILVPLLQVWLYAAADDGAFAKRYDEFCQQLGITQYRYPSKIREKLSPALDELRGHGYLASWEIEKAAEGYKLVIAPGPKYYADRTALRERRQIPGAPAPPRSPSPSNAVLAPSRPVSASAALPAAKESSQPLPVPTASPSPDPALVLELVGQGMSESVARELATARPEECRRQLAYLPYQKVTGSRAGFLRRAIETPGGYGVPAGYEEQQRGLAQAEQQKARRGAQEARRSEAMAELVKWAESLISGPAEAISDFLEFFRAERDKALRVWTPGTTPYNSVVASFEGEKKQLELIVDFYADRPCPVTELKALLITHGPKQLKEMIAKQYGDEKRRLRA